jgi:hypothetical protein
MEAVVSSTTEKTPPTSCVQSSLANVQVVTRRQSVPVSATATNIPTGTLPVVTNIPAPTLPLIMNIPTAAPSVSHLPQIKNGHSTFLDSGRLVHAVITNNHQDAYSSCPYTCGDCDETAMATYHILPAMMNGVQPVHINGVVNGSYHTNSIDCGIEHQWSDTFSPPTSHYGHADACHGHADACHGECTCCGTEWQPEYSYCACAECGTGASDSSVLVSTTNSRAVAPTNATDQNGLTELMNSYPLDVVWWNEAIMK